MVRNVVDDCFEGLDSCDKFVEQFNARLQIWFCMLDKMLHEVVIILRGVFLHTDRFKIFRITFNEVAIRNDDINFNVSLIEEELRNQNGL
jgi:hypothetical protein